MTQIRAENRVAIWMLCGWQMIRTDCLAPLHTRVSPSIVALRRTQLSKVNSSYGHE